MAWGLSIIGNMSQLVVGFNLSMHEGIRKRAMRKRERERLTGKKTS